MANPHPRLTTINTETAALNFDILALIMEYVETRRDLLTAMSTCRALYTAGIQPLVRLHLCLRVSNIQSFHTFMISHDPASFAALHRLHFFAMDPFSKDQFVLVSDLLTRGGTRLQRLEVGCDCHQLGDYRIFQAIASLTNLRRLKLWYIRGGPEELVPVLLQLQSPDLPLLNEFRLQIRTMLPPKRCISFTVDYSEDGEMCCKASTV